MDGNKKSWDNMAGSTVLLELASQGASNLEIEEIMSELYKLKATLGTVTKWIHLSASDDAEAMMQAIPFILDEAVTSRIWARGLIQLVSPAGSVIESMGAK